MLFLALACDGGAPPDPPATCDTPGERTEAATAPDRRLLGPASPYAGDAMLLAREEAMHLSQRERRAAAWEIIARVFAPVPLAEPTPIDGATVPRFRTWYDRDDVRRVFNRAFESLSPGDRAAHAPLSDAALDAAFGWNVHAVDELPSWPPERFAEYVASLDDPAEIAATGGVMRIALSPDAARHVIASYGPILGCVDGGAPPAFVDGPAEATRRLAREPLDLTRCTTRRVGPFFVASGGTFVARVEGDLAAAATLAVSEATTDAPSTSIERCTAAADAGCTLDGPGVFTVVVASGPDGLSGDLVVEHTSSELSPACLAGAFPLGSATVAAEWRRIDIGVPLPVYDTSAPALAARLAVDDATWGDGDDTATPPPESIYTLRLPAGETFALAGLHIRTHELAHDVSITLWFSTTPDDDFGADRPDAIRALGGPWSSYKMCVSIDFDEHDPDPEGGFTDTAPSLAGALAAVHEGTGGPSWCSNPYIDAGPGLVRSNCVGCHQHAMTGVRSADVATDEVRFPENGRMQTRNNFPADRFWGLDAGDDLAAELATVVDFWAGAP